MSLRNTKRKLHILIIPSWYKSPGYPESNTFFEDYARALQDRGHKIGILFPEYIPPSELLSVRNIGRYDFYVDKGIPTFHIKAFAGIPKMRGLSYKRYSKTVYEVYEDYAENYGQPDLVHAHSVFYAGIAGMRIAKKNNIPLLLTEHLSSYLLGNIQDREDIAITKSVLKAATTCTITSETFRADLEKKLHLSDHTFKVIPNFVNDLFFESPQIHNFNPGDVFRVLANSADLSNKNIPVLIEAVKIISDKQIRIHLEIGGVGSDLNSYKEMATRLGVSEQVTFRGFLSRRELKQALDRCHAFIMDNLYDTFTVAPLQSFACGKPVIATYPGGKLDIIPEGTGIVTALHDAASMAWGIEHTAAIYNSFNAEQIIHYSKSNFSQEKVIDELDAQYQAFFN